MFSRKLVLSEKGDGASFWENGWWSVSRVPPIFLRIRLVKGSCGAVACCRREDGKREEEEEGEGSKLTTEDYGGGAGKVARPPNRRCGLCSLVARAFRRAVCGAPSRRGSSESYQELTAPHEEEHHVHGVTIPVSWLIEVSWICLFRESFLNCLSKKIFLLENRRLIHSC